jgi:hypothetical protein
MIAASKPTRGTCMPPRKKGPRWSHPGGARQARGLLRSRAGVHSAGLAKEGSCQQSASGLPAPEHCRWLQLPCPVYMETPLTGATFPAFKLTN